MLVVDDEPAVRNVIQKLLGREGWICVVAEAAEPALSFLDTRKFDLLVTDLNMPGLDGLELVKRAHRAAPELDAILMTAAPTLDTAIDAVNEGLHDYLVKPFTPQTLLTVLGRWRREWELREVLRDTEARMDEALTEMFKSLQTLAATLAAGKDREKAMSVLIRARELAGAVERLRPFTRKDGR